jgi:hypothetical protein
VVRKFLAPIAHELHRLPINAVGCALTMSEEQVNYFKDHVDPLYFKGTHPETNTFVFWSILDTGRLASVEWDNWDGTCTFIGDAAHCMVICKTACLYEAKVERN